MKLHRHTWVLGLQEGERVLIYCEQCEAVVVNEVSHTYGGGHAFAFGVLRPGRGVTSDDLQALGNWFAAMAGQQVAAHIEARPSRRRRRAAARAG
jgi:hypothetical protein